MAATPNKSKHCQRVVLPNEEIGAEIHQLDQFFRVEGTDEAVLGGVWTAIRAGFAVLPRQGPTTTSSTSIMFR